MTGQAEPLAGAPGRIAVRRTVARFDAWLSTCRARRAIRLFLVVQVLGFAFMVAGTHGAFTPLPAPPTTTDFASFYAAGWLANRGEAASAYDEAAHRAAESDLIAPGVEEKRFLYPPVFLLVCAPLSRLPYLAAFALFEASTFAIWLFLVTRIAGGGRLAAMAFAGVPSAWWALGWGQNSFLSAGLMSAGTMLLTRRPLLAGVAFGALCFKPHFGLLLPVALMAGRHWRAMAGAAATAAMLGGLSAACFGPASWRAFLAVALHARATIETGIRMSGHVDLGGAARLAGMPAGASWVLQACLAAGSLACVAWLWAWARAPQGSATDRQAVANAGLVAATLTAMPFLLFYDLVVASVAAAWLAHAARRTGWHPGERTWLAVLMGVDLVAFLSAASLHLALGALVAPALLRLVLRRAVTPGRELPCRLPRIGDAVIEEAAKSFRRGSNVSSSFSAMIKWSNSRLTDRFDSDTT